MSVRVYNAPDVDRMQMGEVFKSLNTKRDRDFNPDNSFISQSFLGTDLLQLSDDKSEKPKTKKSTSTNSYSGLIKLLIYMLIIGAVISLSMSALVALGGIVSLIIFALLVLTSVFLFSINLNPFDKNTYKKILSSLR
jgi:hypothetical protein